MVNWLGSDHRRSDRVGLARAVNLFLLVGRVSSELVDEQVRVMSGSTMDLIPIIQG